MTYKQSKRQFLVGEREIFGVDEETMKKGEKLVEVEEGSVITGGVVDPIHELLTYVVGGREIVVMDKTLKK